MIRKKRKLTMALVLVFVISTLLSGCSTYDNFKEGNLIEVSEAQNDTVRIGVFEPLSGEYKEYGQFEKQGVELAHKLFPEVLGKKVELVFADNKSDDDVAATVAQELVNKNVSVVLGSYSSPLSLIGGEYFKEAKIPAIAISARNPLITSSNDYYFRVCYLESFQGVAMAKYAVEELGTSKAAIFQDIEDDHVTAVVQAFSDKFKLLIGDEAAILKAAEYTSHQEDFRSELRGIKDSGAEVVFLAGNALDSATIIKQARELGIDAIFLGTHEWETEEFVKAGGAAVEGVKFASYFDPESQLTESTKMLLEAYKKEYGEEAVPDSRVALGFDAYLVAINAIKNAGTAANGVAIKQKLAETWEFPGASGTISLDMNGDPVKSVAIKTIANGKFVYIYTVEPAWQ